MALNFQATRFLAWFGNQGDNAFLGITHLGPIRATYEAAKADLDSPEAVKSRGQNRSYGGGIEEADVVVAVEAETAIDPRLAESVDVLALPTRVAKALKDEGIVTVGDLARQSRWELMRLPGIGHKALNAMLEVLYARGLYLRE